MRRVPHPDPPACFAAPAFMRPDFHSLSVWGCAGLPVGKIGCKIFSKLHKVLAMGLRIGWNQGRRKRAALCVDNGLGNLV